MKTYQKAAATLGLLGALMFNSQAYAEKSKFAVTSTSVAESEQNPSVAILNFKYNTKNKPNVEEMLATNMAGFDCVALYERSGLQSILREMKIGMTGIVDEKTAAKVGKVAGVEKVILGSYNLAGDKARIDIRYIDVATGKVEFGKGIIGNAKDLSLVDRLAENLRTELCPEIEPPIATEETRTTFDTPNYDLKNGVYSVRSNGKILKLMDVRNCPEAIERLIKLGEASRFSEDGIETVIVSDAKCLLGLAHDIGSDTYELKKEDGSCIRLADIEKCSAAYRGNLPDVDVVSKDITCYQCKNEKVTAKTFKNKSGKCPAGWSKKAPECKKVETVESEVAPPPSQGAEPDNPFATK